MTCCIIILPMPVFESTVARVETVHDFPEPSLRSRREQGRTLLSGGSFVAAGIEEGWGQDAMLTGETSFRVFRLFEAAQRCQNPCIASDRV